MSFPEETAAAAPLKVVLDFPRNRHYYYRGEKIPVRLEAGTGAIKGVLRLSMVRDGESFSVVECSCPARETPVQTEIATANLACGDYQLRILGMNGDKETVVYETTVSLCPRNENPTFFFGVKGALAGNPYRQELMLKDLVSSGMNIGIVFRLTPSRYAFRPRHQI